MVRIKKNDKVRIIQGQDRNKIGKVLEVFRKKGKVRVEGIAVAVRHHKARRRGEVSGKKCKEQLIDISNVMPIIGSNDRPCRVNSKIVESHGKKRRVRVCNYNKEVF